MGLERSITTSYKKNVGINCVAVNVSIFRIFSHFFRLQNNRNKIQKVVTTLLPQKCVKS